MEEIIIVGIICTMVGFFLGLLIAAALVASKDKE